MTSDHGARSVSDIDCSIGRRIAALREARGLSQATIGKALGISFQQVAKYEQGKNRITAARLILMADILNVDYQYFLEGVDEVAFQMARESGLYDPQVVELTLAFANIKDVEIRNSVLSIAKAAASLQPKD